jgi:hypothetical protein
MERDDEDRSEAASAYAYNQLARAFVTALTHEDAATRERAGGRFDRWRAVYEGMLSGRLRIGSRTPIVDLPPWATPEVVRGGFATGTARAAAGTGPSTARVAFDDALTVEGLDHLRRLLDEGAYRVAVPEHAALGVVAWLVGAHDLDAARALVDVLAPYADRLRFAPPPASPGARAGRAPGRRSGTPAAAAASDGDYDPIVFRASAGEVREQLGRRGPNERLLTQREALLVWNPFADEVLALWLETAEPDSTRVGALVDDAWRSRARGMLDRYASLALTHRRCAKHRRPKENLAILLAGLRAAVGGVAPPSLLQTAVDAMVARRGAPGSSGHEELRRRQRAEAVTPTHQLLGQVVAARLGAARDDAGLTVATIASASAPVAAEEVEPNGRPPGALDGALAVGTEIPPSLRRVVDRARAGTVRELVDGGVLRSAELLAAILPEVVAAKVAAGYPDEPLRRLMAANYLAFRERRSLLLLDLEQQVRLEELPWVAAVAGHRRRDEHLRELARTTLTDAVDLALRAFPGTPTPSPFVTELEALARQAERPLPLVHLIAADIFMGTFTAGVVRAAQHAAERLRGTVYQRYYGIDPDMVSGIDDLRATRADGPATSATFDALCRRRAGVSAADGFSIAASGAVVEQAMILTTQNLAALTDPALTGADPTAAPDWPALAAGAFARVATLAGHLRDTDASRRSMARLAAAWRQMTFFLSLSPDPGAVISETSAALSQLPERARRVLAPAVHDLTRAIEGEPIDPTRRVVGWVPGSRHWMLTVAGG